MRWAWRVAVVLGLTACGSAEGSGAETDASSSSSNPGSEAGDTTAPASSSTTTVTDPTTSGRPDPSTTSALDTSSSAGDPSSSSSGGVANVCEAGSFPTMWQDGTSCPEDTVQVHRYSENTFILRQSLCTGFEGPFLYLLFGEDRVLLEDTGYNGVNVASVVGEVIEGWLAEQGRDSIDLVVVNSHGHGDHVGGNNQFQGAANTTVVGFDVASISDFFGIENWREEIVEYDLGGRVLDVIPIPGHQSAHVAFFDRNEGLLFTGDTLYPGRLYIQDFPSYVSSIERMVAHVESQEVCWVFGTHIEMTDQPGVDFDFGADEHPNERELQLGLEHLVELRDAVAAMDQPVQEVHDDFIIFPL
jgi:glyoxylase-like metal-dependent hydrolase (beta-lactamase superfamily II)